MVIWCWIEDRIASMAGLCSSSPSSSFVVGVGCSSPGVFSFSGDGGGGGGDGAEENWRKEMNAPDFSNELVSRYVVVYSDNALATAARNLNILLVFKKRKERERGRQAVECADALSMF